LSACNDVIMSTGTYGWWAGWLAAGKTVYYRRWPRRGSPLDAAFNRRDFFPSHWIALWWSLVSGSLGHVVIEFGTWDAV